MQDFEKLGVFYLGRPFDLERGAASDQAYLYDAKDLTTHAMCVGMTGSGKTGLCLSLLEEAAIDGIPVLAIDPKGDLGNLLLTFPNLAASDFAPWVDEAEATRKGLTREQLSEQVAATWKKGLENSGQNGERIARLRAAADFAIYTPGSTAGLPLSILRSLAAPKGEGANDEDAVRERLESAVTGLLGLLGIDADPLTSREHILISTILDLAWRDGRDVALAALIREIQKPAFTSLGAFDLETFFPSDDRTKLAMRLNSLLASPAFAAWAESEPLDVQSLLYTADGRPRVSILSIAHLSDAQRMFFVTLLLNEVVAWMRARSGTSSLRAVLYMDEVFGYLPPIANPPSKKPMLTLLKQARAFGLGCVFATQNPVDLDYKALSNIGTWFLGRLQTERDKLRVLDGLEGAAASAGGHFDRAAFDRMLSSLTQRVFLVSNAHDDAPTLIQSRFALCYLRGPLTRPQIQSLMSTRRGTPASAERESRTSPTVTPPEGANSSRPVVATEFRECFARPEAERARIGTLAYQPRLLASGKVHFVSARDDVDVWSDVFVIAPAILDDPWSASATKLTTRAPLDLGDPPPADARFAALPSEFSNGRSHAQLERSLREWLIQNHALSLFSAPELGLTAKPGENEGEFRARAAFAARERRDLEIEKLRAKYAPKLATLEDRVRRAEQAVERESSQSTSSTLSSVASIGASILGAFFGRRSVSTSRAVSAARSIGRAAEQHQDVRRAQENVEALREDHATLGRELDAAAEEIRGRYGADRIAIEQKRVTLRKGDLGELTLRILWVP